MFWSSGESGAVINWISDSAKNIVGILQLLEVAVNTANVTAGVIMEGVKVVSVNGLERT